MYTLDQKIQIKKINNSPVAKSLSLFPEQLVDSWREAGEVKLPSSYKDFDQIVFCGMGGSNLAPELIQSVFGSQIKKPVILIRDYHLPAFVNKNTLVFICSYSGGTEESVSCFHETRNRKAKIFCLASGGEIINSAKKNRLPYYQFSTKTNPSGQPRYGLGLQIGALLNILTRLKVINLSNQKIADLAKYIEELGIHFSPESIFSK